MEFGRPDMLIWLWLAPALALVLVVGWRKRAARLKLIGGMRAGSFGGVHLFGGRAVLKGLMLVTALVLVVVAMARPRWGFDWVDVKRQGIDLVIAVDVSRSMMAEDVKPNRLARAKREVIDLLGRMRGDRVGLVAFAGRAFVQCPVTEDYGAARMFLDYLAPDLIPVQGTDLAGAVRAGIKALEDGSPDGSEGRAILLITDGEDMAGEAQAAAAEAKAKGVRLFAIGVGTESGAPIPEENGGFKKDARGSVILSRPDEKTLASMAVETGGMYVRSVGSDEDLAKIYDEGIAAGSEDRELKTTREKRWHEQFQWFVAGALLLLVLERFIKDHGTALRGVTASALGATLVVVMLGGAGTAEAADLDAAHSAYEKGDFPAATKGFQEAESESPEVAEYSYNRAVSQYREGRFAEAAEGFAKAARSKDPKLAGKSLYNLGNATASLGKYDEAVRAYESALALDPKDTEARENLEYVKKLEQEQKKEEQKQEEQKEEQKQDDGKQEEQKQDQQQGDGKQPDQKQDGEGQKQDSQDQQGEQKQSEPDQQKDGKDGAADEQNQPKPEQKPEGQGKDEKPADQEAEKQQAAEAGPGADGKTPTMGEEEAEQVLRAVQDQAGRYIYGPPEDGSGEAAPPPEKDW